jgi:hypothetical protein
MSNKYHFNSNSLLFSFLVFLFLSSCKQTEDLSANYPQFTKVENLAKLNIGMSKKAVLTKLENVYPHEILNGTGNCEIHEYFYLKPRRSVKNTNGVLKRDQLTSGDPKYSGSSKAYVVYKDTKLSVVYTNIGLDELSSLLNTRNLISEKCQNELTVTKGCTDPLSLTYDSKALEDDGSCEYCECGMVPNPEYNDKRPLTECNAKCISEDLLDINGKVIKNTNKDPKSKKCDKCDLIDALVGSDVSIQLNLNSKKKNKNTFKVVDKNLLVPNEKNKKSKKKSKFQQKLEEISNKQKTASNTSETKTIKVY